MQTGLVTWTQKINDGLLLQAQRTWRSTQLGCQEIGHSCSFVIRSRISGHGSSSSRSIDGRWIYFISLLSYWQNGSWHLHEIFARIEGGNIQNCFDGNRLYAFSWNLKLSENKKESLTYQIWKTKANWFWSETF